jgi:hypothetical protein
MYWDLLMTGSGSTYVYGYCDATYQDGWNEEQTVEFVKNSTSLFRTSDFIHAHCDVHRDPYALYCQTHEVLSSCLIWKPVASGHELTIQLLPWLCHEMDRLEVVFACV